MAILYAILYAQRADDSLCSQSVRDCPTIFVSTMPKILFVLSIWLFVYG